MSAGRLGFEALEQIFNGGVAELRDLPLISSYKYPLYAAVAYLLLIKIIGPAVMRRRKPMNVRPLMIAYNFGLVSVYLYLVTKAFTILSSVGSEIYCKKLLESEITPQYKELLYLLYYTHAMKHIEMLDTVFLVMRKESSRITMLHVVHRAFVPLIGFILIRTERSTYIIPYVYLNSVIHVFMYSYYGIAAMGPQFQKYLWWKKYLTILQIGQFVAMTLYMVVIWYIGCMTSAIAMFFTAFFTLVFLWLFVEFYKATFHGKKRLKY